MAASKKASKKTKPVLRGRFRSARSVDGEEKYSGEDLRKMVRAACLQLFVDTFGKEHQTVTETQVAYNPDPDNLEREAQRIWGDLRKAMQTAVQFVNAHPVGLGSPGHVRNFLSWWVRDFVEPLTEHAGFALVEGQPILDASRVRMICKFEDYDILGLRAKVPSRRLSTYLSARELAVVSLLCGTSELPELAIVRDQHWQAKVNERMKVREVLKRETDTMQKLLKSHGKTETLDTDCQFAPVIRGK